MSKGVASSLGPGEDFREYFIWANQPLGYSPDPPHLKSNAADATSSTTSCFASVVGVRHLNQNACKSIETPQSNYFANNLNRFNNALHFQVSGRFLVDFLTLRSSTLTDFRWSCGCGYTRVISGSKVLD